MAAYGVQARLRVNVGYSVGACAALGEYDSTRVGAIHLGKVVALVFYVVEFLSNYHRINACFKLIYQSYVVV